jgi:hypothetical protein
MFDRKIAVWRWDAQGASRGALDSNLQFGAACRPSLLQRLNQLLAEHDFDRFVKGQCRRF